MTEISIYQFKDYRDWLQAEMQTRVKKNAQWSVNAFASRVFMSQSLLSLILRGKRKLTIKRAEPIAEYLELSDQERKYLRLMLQLEHAPSPTTRAVILRDMEALSGSTESNLKFQDWVMAACELSTIEPTAAGIADYLQAPLEKVEYALENLSLQELVAVKDGLYFVTKPASPDHLPRVFAGDPLRVQRAQDYLRKAHEEIVALLKGDERSELFEVTLNLRPSQRFSLH